MTRAVQVAGFGFLGVLQGHDPHAERLDRLRSQLVEEGLISGYAILPISRSRSLS
jgi:hypothetical protein